MVEWGEEGAFDRERRRARGCLQTSVRSGCNLHGNHLGAAGPRRYHDWPEGLQRYIDDIRQGKGQNPKQYSSRYVCSLVADFHRTLIYGGWAANPREHLRLVYEANPLAFLAEQASGAGVCVSFFPRPPVPLSLCHTHLAT